MCGFTCEVFSLLLENGSVDFLRAFREVEFLPASYTPSPPSALADLFLMESSVVLVFWPLEGVTAVACCLGNVLVIWAVWTCGALRQPTFCFIVSLAVADFLVGLVTIPLAVLLGIHMKIPFYGCLFMCCVAILLEVASVILLLAIAVDRFLRVYIPLR